MSSSHLILTTMPATSMPDSKHVARLSVPSTTSPIDAVAKNYKEMWCLRSVNATTAEDAVEKTKNNLNRCHLITADTPHLIPYASFDSYPQAKQAKINIDRKNITTGQSTICVKYVCIADPSPHTWLPVSCVNPTNDSIVMLPLFEQLMVKPDSAQPIKDVYNNFIEQDAALIADLAQCSTREQAITVLVDQYCSNEPPLAPHIHLLTHTLLTLMKVNIEQAYINTLNTRLDITHNTTDLLDVLIHNSVCEYLSGNTSMSFRR